jgi:hypothetical protein
MSFDFSLSNLTSELHLREIAPSGPLYSGYVNGFVPASQDRRQPVPTSIGVSVFQLPRSRPLWEFTNSFSAFSKTSSGMPIAYFTVSLSIYSFPLPGSCHRLHSHWKILAYPSSTVITSLSEQAVMMLGAITDQLKCHLCRRNLPCRAEAICISMHAHWLQSIVASRSRSYSSRSPGQGTVRAKKL